MLRACDALQLPRHMQNNANGSTNHTLATLGLCFKMSSECKTSDDNVFSDAKTNHTNIF